MTQLRRPLSSVVSGVRAATQGEPGTLMRSRIETRAPAIGRPLSSRSVTVWRVERPNLTVRLLRPLTTMRALLDAFAPLLGAPTEAPPEDPPDVPPATLVVLLL